MNTVNYYRIYSDISKDYLLEDEEVYLTQIEIKKTLKKTTNDGRLNVKPKKIDLISELEMEEEHYDKDEIDEVARRSVPEEFDNMGDLYMVSDIFLTTIEKAGVTSFKAYPIYLSHDYTERV